MDRAVQEEPEEGEIIDDFEVVSDRSMPSSPGTGKLSPRASIIRAISLSSISDSDWAEFEARKPRPRRKRKRASGRRRSLRAAAASDTDSDAGFDDRLRKQLRQAVCVDDGAPASARNPLQTRLKAMLVQNGVKQPDTDEELNTLREIALSSNSKESGDKKETIGKNKEGNEGNKRDDDEELFQLRLDALKSAMIQKAVERKKRKENKENKQETDVAQKNDGSVQNNNVDSSNNNSIDEDVDIMRAMLLVSMSKKVIPKDIDTIKTPVNQLLKKGPQRKPLNIKLKPVKKLIINLQDTDESEGEGKPSKEVDLKSDEKINEFLKAERAKVEESKAKQQQKSDDDDLKLDKSIVKLLPKTQQKEYQMLMQKLLQARRKRLRKFSEKTRSKAPVTQADAKTVPLQTAVAEVKKTGRKINASGGERLLVKGRYKALTPLFQKINEAAAERKRCESTINRLLAELQKARDKLHSTHQTYSDLVVKLQKAKKAVDKGFASTNRKICKNNTKVTSTPIKEDTTSISCNLSTIVKNSLPIVTETSPVTEKDVKNKAETNKTANNYESPLNDINSEYVNDPLIMYCPFDLFGVCKDAECKFNHCAKT